MGKINNIKGLNLFIGVVLILSLVLFSGKIGMWLCVLLLFLIAIFLLYSLIVQIKTVAYNLLNRLYARDISLKLLATIMGFFLVLGTLIYLYVFYTIGHDATISRYLGHEVEFSNAEYLFRSLICSLDLFMLDVDSNVLDRLDGNAALKGWLSIQAVLSFACTIAVLVGLVFSRFHAYYRLNYMTTINGEKNHLYLFFGDNDPSELLIKDIMLNDPKVVAIIIDESEVNDGENDEWRGIVSMVTHKQKVFTVAKRIGARVAIASQQLADIDDEIVSRGDFDAFEFLGLHKIKDLISGILKISGSQLHIFFMGDDEELNIRNIITLAKDRTIISMANKENFEHHIYCHARYNGPNRVIQDVSLSKKLDVKIVDSSHLAVELLKMDPENHPVNVVNMSDTCPATVESCLKTLIIGFGEVGRDAFRFLYEFGAFVDDGNLNRRSPFECVIVDKNIDDIIGTFVSSMPGVFNDKYNDSSVAVKFVNADYNSSYFNTEVLSDEFLKAVNYIVISIGNDDEAIALAVRLFDRIRRWRADITNLRIFVRCKDDNRVEVLNNIADHYNYGYGNGAENIPVIRIFGQPEKTYTYDLIVSDRLIKEGKQFHEEYRRFSGDTSGWDKRHAQLTETDIPQIDNLRKLRRQESQDIANALHAGTKIILLKKALASLAKHDHDKIDWESFYNRYFKVVDVANIVGSYADIHYPELTDMENKVVFHLAILEHIRWKAAHELMGYIFYEGGTSCDERTMKHNCLCHWGMLDYQGKLNKAKPCDFKKYDFCVIDTTIAINKENLIHSRSIENRSDYGETATR